MVLCDWLLSFIIIFSRFIYAEECNRTLFPVLPDNLPLYRYTMFCLSIHQLNVQALVWTMFSLHLGIYPAAKLLSHRVILFNILKNCQTAFPRCCTNLRSHQQCMRILISAYSCQCLLLSVFFIITILVVSHYGFDFHFPNSY